MRNWNKNQTFGIRIVGLGLILLSIGLVVPGVWAQEKATEEEAVPKDLREALEPTETKASEPTAVKTPAPTPTKTSEPPVRIPPSGKSQTLKAVVTKVTGKHAQYSVDKGKSWKPLKEAGCGIGQRRAHTNRFRQRL